MILANNICTNDFTQHLLYKPRHNSNSSLIANSICTNDFTQHLLHKPRHSQNKPKPTIYYNYNFNYN